MAITSFSPFSSNLMPIKPMLYIEQKHKKNPSKIPFPCSKLLLHQIYYHFISPPSQPIPKLLLCTVRNLKAPPRLDHRNSTVVRPSFTTKRTAVLFHCSNRNLDASSNPSFHRQPLIYWQAKPIATTDPILRLARSTPSSPITPSTAPLAEKLPESAGPYFA